MASITSLFVHWHLFAVRISNIGEVSATVAVKKIDEATEVTLLDERHKRFFVASTTRLAAQAVSS